MAFTDELWHAIEPIYAEILRHPFLTGLSDGSLSRDSFQFYAVQDALYLREFARGLSIAAARAPRDEWIIMFNEHAAEALRVERVLHEGFFQELGLSPDDVAATPLAPTNVAYTSYLQAVAAREGPLEIVAAVLPCAWSYVEIADRLAGERAHHPVYSEWVGFYLTDEVCGLVGTMREDFDSMAREAHLGPARRRRLAEIFAMSSRLEGAFWEMAYTLDQWPDLRVGSETPIARQPAPASAGAPAQTALTGPDQDC